jgi:hypothetical protein
MHSNNQAAQIEALAMIADLARDIIGDLETDLHWGMEVSDETSQVIFALKITGVEPKQ